MELFCRYPADGRTLFVAGSNSDTVSVLDLAARLARVPAPLYASR